MSKYYDSVKAAVKRRHERGCSYIKTKHIADDIGVDSGNQICNEIHLLRQEDVLIPHNPETVAPDTYKINVDEL